MKLRLSHCVLYVRDLDAMVDFYRDVLGFQVSDRGPMDPSAPEGIELVFLSQVGSEHHQIAFAPVRGDGPSTTLDHMAFRVDSLEEVRAMARKLSEDGRSEGIAPVSHGNAWSVYFNDPEGNRLEVFCDSPFHVRQPQIQPLDLELPEEELTEVTRTQFGQEADFMPMGEFLDRRRETLGD